MVGVLRKEEVVDNFDGVSFRSVCCVFLFFIGLCKGDSLDSVLM
jgi:hypothetical protein